MNLNELSQKLEDHLTDQDIQDAQELLDDTYQEIVDMRGELVEAQAKIERLKTKMVTLFDAIKHGDQDHQDWLFGAIRKHFGAI